MADVYAGKEFSVLIGKETDFGTPVTANKDVGLVQSFTVNETNSIRALHAAGSRRAHELVAGRYGLTASLEVKFQHGRLLEYAMGTETETGSTDKKHAFTSAATLPSFTLYDEHNSTSDVRLAYEGMKVNSLTIALAMDGEVTLRADLIGQSVVTGTSVTGVTLSTLPVLTDFMATAKWGTAGAETTKADVQSLEFTINNNLEPIYGTGSRVLTDLQGNEQTYTGRCKLGFSSKTDQDLFLGGTSPDADGMPTIPGIIFDISNGTAVNSGRRQILIDLSSAVFTTVGKSSSYKGYTTQDFAFQAKTIDNLYTYDNITTLN